MSIYWYSVGDMKKLTTTIHPMTASRRPTFKQHVLKLCSLTTIAFLAVSPAYAENDNAKVVAKEANGKKVTAEAKLAQSLVSAIADNDIVAYSQCWTSSRDRRAALAKYFPTMSQERVDKLVSKLAPRNKIIIKSFEAIQKHISVNKITSDQIKLKSFEVEYNLEEIYNSYKIVSATKFIILMEVNGQEWKYVMDDSGEFDDQWYFGDSPISISVGKKTIEFRK